MGVRELLKKFKLYAHHLTSKIFYHWHQLLWKMNFWFPKKINNKLSDDNFDHMVDSEENKKTIFIYRNYVGTSIQKHYFFIHDYFFLLNDNYHILINSHAHSLASNNFTFLLCAYIFI